MYIHCMNEETTAKILAMIVTDGCITGSSRKIKIRFTNKSKDLHDVFKELIEEIKPEKYNFIEFSDKNNVTTTEINSNIFGRELRSLIGDKKILPRFTENLDTNILKQVLSLMFSCDGSPVFTQRFDKKKNILRNVKRVKFFSKNTALLLQVKSLLQKLGFEPQISKFEIILEKNRDITKFKREIRFVDNVRMSRNSKWNFLTKNDVLDMMVDSSFHNSHQAHTG